MKECGKYLEMISARLDGELTAAAEEQLEAHLAGCEECRRAAAELSALHRALGASTLRVQPPADLTARIMAAVAAETPKTIPFPTRPQRRAHRRWAWAGGVAAVLAVAVLTTLTVRLHGGAGDSGGAAAPMLAAGPTAESSAPQDRVLEAAGAEAPTVYGLMDGGSRAESADAPATQDGMYSAGEAPAEAASDSMPVPSLRDTADEPPEAGEGTAPDAAKEPEEEPVPLPGSEALQGAGLDIQGAARRLYVALFQATWPGAEALEGGYLLCPADAEESGGDREELEVRYERMSETGAYYLFCLYRDDAVALGHFAVPAEEGGEILAEEDSAYASGREDFWARVDGD